MVTATQVDAVTGNVIIVEVFFYKDANDIVYQNPTQDQIQELGLVQINYEQAVEIEAPNRIINAIDIATSKYESDRFDLNSAWLAAMVADGATESERKIVIAEQMAQLDADFDVEIISIIEGG